MRARSSYDAVGTQTFREHFGSPVVKPRRSPLELFWDDFRVILSNIKLLPDIVKPIKTKSDHDELYPGPPQGLSNIWLAFWSLVQAPASLAIIIIGTALVYVAVRIHNLYKLLIWDVIQGPMLQVWPAELPEPGTYNPRYRWIFVNGIMVDKEILQQELEVLSKTFHAPVLAVHNRTYGFVGDLIECVWQRAFNWQTLETRMAEPIVKKYLHDTENVDKVILVAHSQGGIIASDILKVIYAEVPWKNIHGRLEVYTFGSAARRFKNPKLQLHSEEWLVAHMEHYCHELDFVTRYGALASVQAAGAEGHKDIDKEYRGHVFVAKGKTGHLLNQHYLANMFPLSEHENTPAEGSFLMQKTSRRAESGQHNVYDVYVSDAKGPLVKDISHLAKYYDGEHVGA